MAKKEKVSITDILSKYGASNETNMLSTGSLTLDQVLGGGTNKGSMYVFWGEQGSGKSTCASQIVRTYCKEGKKVLYIDAEKALNAIQIESFELTPFLENQQLVVLNVDNFVELTEIIKASDNDDFDFDLVVLDSITSVHVFQDVEDFDILSNQPAQHAKQSQGVLTLMRTVFTKKGITSIIIAHARANITMQATPYTPDKKMAGGFALRHIPDVLLEVKSGSKLKRDNGEVYGQIVRVTAEKNKFAVPFNPKEVKLIFGKGISMKDEVLELSIKYGFIEVSGGGNYKLPDGTTVRGQSNLKTSISKETFQSLYEKVIERLNEEL